MASPAQEQQQLARRASSISARLGLPKHFFLKALLWSLFLAALWLWRASRRRRRAALELLNSIPEELIRALRNGDAVLLLGPRFAAALDAKPMPCQKLARAIVTQSKAGQQKIESGLERIDANKAEGGLPEATLGIASEVAGWGRLQSMAAFHWAEVAPKSKTDKQILRSRLAAAARLPFTATLSTMWRKEFDQFFRCRVGRNFGGFAALVSKPRVDLTSAAARPALLLWPALYGGSFFAATSSSSTPAEDGASPTAKSKREAHAEAPWHSCEEVERILDEEGPYCIFLRDLFKSKVVLMLGFPGASPGEGHLGQALAAAWKEVRARSEVSGAPAEPLGYSLTSEMISNAQSILETFGIAPILVSSGFTPGSSEEFFLSLLKSRLQAEDLEAEIHEK